MLAFIVYVVAALLIAGLGLTLVNVVTDDAAIRSIARFVVLAALVLWLVGMFVGVPFPSH